MGQTMPFNVSARLAYCEITINHPISSLVPSPFWKARDRRQVVNRCSVSRALKANVQFQLIIRWRTIQATVKSRTDALWQLFHA